MNGGLSDIIIHTITTYDTVNRYESEKRMIQSIATTLVNSNQVT